MTHEEISSLSLYIINLYLSPFTLFVSHYVHNYNISHLLQRLSSQALGQEPHGGPTS